MLTKGIIQKYEVWQNEQNTHNNKTQKHIAIKESCPRHRFEVRRGRLNMPRYINFRQIHLIGIYPELSR